MLRNGGRQRRRAAAAAWRSAFDRGAITLRVNETRDVVLDVARPAQRALPADPNGSRVWLAGGRAFLPVDARPLVGVNR